MKITFNFWTALAIVTVILVLIATCKRCSYIKNGNTTDTVSVKVDTIYLQAKKDTTYIPKVKDSIVYVPQKYTIHDTTIAVIPKDVDSLAILKDYFSQYIYSDTQNIKYGNIVINDTVSQNKIQKRRLIVNQNIPQTEKIVTLTQPKKTILYFSLLGQIQQPDGSLGIGGGLMLKSKNDNAIELDYLINSHNQTSYQLSYKLPIRLRKQ